jgi:hypothetical protein
MCQKMGTQLRTKAQTMKTFNRITRIGVTTLVTCATLGAFAAVGPSATAATLRCNTKNKGVIVSGRVCSINKGRFAWVKVVPAPASPGVVNGKVYTAPDGSWSVTIPSTWSVSEYDPNKAYIIVYPNIRRGEDGFWMSASDSFSIAVYDDNAEKNAADHLEEAFNDYSKVGTIVSRKTGNLDGKPSGTLQFYNTPDTVSTFVFAKAGPKKLISVQTSIVRTDKAAPQIQADLNNILASVTIG